MNQVKMIGNDEELGIISVGTEMTRDNHLWFLSQSFFLLLGSILIFKGDQA